QDERSRDRQRRGASEARGGARRPERRSQSRFQRFVHVFSRRVQTYGFASGARCGYRQGGRAEQAGRRAIRNSERDVSLSSNDVPPPASREEARSGVVTRLSPLTRRLIAGN